MAVLKMPIDIFQNTTVLDKKLAAVHCTLRTHSPSKNVQNEKHKKFYYCKEKLVSYWTSQNGNSNLNVKNLLNLLINLYDLFKLHYVL